MADGKSSASGLKTSNLYTLTSNDNPGNLITQVQLKGENYEEWARAVHTALRAKKKHGFIDGSITEPASDATEFEDWGAVNSMLVSWIRNTIEPTLRSTISHVENARKLWEDIRQRFSMGNGPRVQQLKSDMANCKLNGEAIVTYYGKLKMLWDELGNYEQIPLCTCSGCKCNLTAKLEKKAEEDRVHQFLMRLDEEVYGTLRSNILSTEPLPNLNKVYAMAIQQERVKTMMKVKEERGTPMSFAIQAGVRNTGKNKDKAMTCSNCKREGHDAENCFQLIGYPEWWGNRPRTGGGRDGGRKPGTGGSREKLGAARANATQALGGDTNRGVINDSDRKGLSGLNDEQWATLLGMLTSHKNGTTERLMALGDEITQVNSTDDHEIEVVGVSNGCEQEQCDEITTEIVIPEESLGKGQRVRRPSTRLRDYVTHTIKQNENHTLMLKQ
ncbi:retrovirus-related Pol polyprotein from transposon TNT 1-94 [Senna tora]|uniref:Retrovirus-related Pol polyprotein from transposon TNT 1-94 n=1 Tax=Senna tora TaxID=362788 RepID=A0A834TG00_9FABA|nr:retrovirus-related Pol polyprotein from transposon TNT 1-94 [Senna tora]